MRPLRNARLRIFERGRHRAHIGVCLCVRVCVCVCVCVSECVSVSERMASYVTRYT